MSRIIVIILLTWSWEYLTAQISPASGLCGATDKPAQVFCSSMEIFLRVSFIDESWTWMKNLLGFCTSTTKACGQMVGHYNYIEPLKKHQTVKTQSSHIKALPRIVNTKGALQLLPSPHPSYITINREL